MRVRYTSQARDDLAAILKYISERSPAGARSVKSAINATIKIIAEFPHGGRRAGEDTARMLPVGRYPYLLYWIVEARHAWLVHIRHAHRQPWDRNIHMADPFENPFATFTEWNEPSNDVYDTLIDKSKVSKKKIKK